VKQNRSRKANPKPNGPAGERDPILGIDFGGMYREQCRRSSFGPRTSADWDRRAERRSRGEGGSDYTRAFLKRVDWTGLETALDVGCGTGNLAVPLARRLRTVHALDFSPEMLRFLERKRKRARLDNIVTHRLSWTDSWKEVPPADLVVCSRALAVQDLGRALRKLHRMARRRCMVSLHAGGHFLGADVRALLGRDTAPRPGYIYAVNLLYQMGVQATVDFIRSVGGLGYESVEEFLGAVRWRIGSLASAEEKRLRRFFLNLPPDRDGKRRYRHGFTWALLTWETNP